jgi:peptidyl-dipeptidase A
MSHIYQFQFYKALCKLAEHDGQLHLCDFYGSTTAGARLKWVLRGPLDANESRSIVCDFPIRRKMMSLGASRHWKYALKTLTGQDEISTDALFEYFDPLLTWLEIENSKYPNDEPGWKF